MLIMRLTDLDPERVPAELTGWATAFARGQVRHPLLAPALESGEHWAARIGRAGKHQLSQEDLREPNLLTGGGYRDDHFQAAAVLLPHQARREVQLDWLKFEAVFAAHQDRLDAWTAALPDRLAAIAANAKEEA
jgi:hypothetical protein